MIPGDRWLPAIHGHGADSGGKDQTSEPSASDVGAKALLFITSARLNSLTNRQLAKGLCHPDKTLGLQSGFPARPRCLHHQEGAACKDPWLCSWSLEPWAGPSGGWMVL